ncbi:MAG: hypothetical protein ACRDU5_07840 [Mycobacterium sp.]
MERRERNLDGYGARPKRCDDNVVGAREVADDWHARSQAEIRTLVWSQPSIKHSFYKNAHGEVHILSRCR